MGNPPAAVGAKIQRAVTSRTVGQREHRVSFMHIQANVGVTRVILQQDIVLGHMSLDKTALQHKRLKLRWRNDHIKMIDMADHESGLGGMRSRVLKVLTDSVFQFLRFTNIDDLVVFITHNVNARLKRQAAGLFL